MTCPECNHEMERGGTGYVLGVMAGQHIWRYQCERGCEVVADVMFSTPPQVSWYKDGKELIAGA